MAEAKCSLDWIQVGKQQYPYDTMIRAVNSARKVGNTKEGRLRGFGVLKSHNPKAVESGKATFQDFEKYLNQKIEAEYDLDSREITQTDLVGYDSDATSVQQLLDLLNLDKYRFTEVTGETGVLLNNDIVREIAYRRRDIMKNGPYSHTDVDKMLSELTDLNDMDLVRSELVSKRKVALSKMKQHSFDAAISSQIDSVLRIPIDEVIAANAIYEMKTILDQIGQRKKIPTIAGISTLGDLASEIIQKTANKIGKQAKAENKPYDDKAEREVKAQHLIDNPINTDELNRDTTGNFAYNILRKASVESLKLLTLEQLSALELSRANIENGIINTHAFKALIALGSKNKVLKLLPLANTATLTKFSLSKAYGSVRTLFDDFTALGTVLNTHPAYIIDQFLGNGTGTEWYDTIFNNIAKANQLYLRKLQEAIEMKDTLLLDREREFKKSNPDQSEETFNNRLVESNMRVSLYLQKRLGDSNVGETLIDTHVDNILNKSNKRQYHKKTKDLLEKLWNKVQDLNADEMFNNLTPSEQAIVKFNDDTAAELVPILQQIGVQHGEYPRMLNNYVYTSIMSSDGNQDAEIQRFKEKFGTKGYKSEALKVKVHGEGAILNLLNPLDGVVKAVKMNYMDYYLTPEINQSLSAASQLQSHFKDEGTDGEEITEAVHDLIKSFVERDIRNKLNSKPRSTTESIFKFLERAGYQVQLLAVEKIIGEFTTNVAHALTARRKEVLRAFTLNIAKNRLLGEKIMVANGGTDVMDKLYGESLAGSVHIEKNVLEPGPSRATQGTEGFLGALQDKLIGLTSSAKGLHATLQQISNWAFTTPDRAIAMLLFWGTFHSEYEKLTGEELTDAQYEQMANDPDFRRQNQDNIETAMNIAATTVKQSSGAREVYAGIGSGQVDPNDPAHAAIYKGITTWMQRFALFEQASMITGVNSVIGQGPLTPTQGAQLIAAGMARSLLYFPLLLGMQAGFKAALGAEEEEIDWENEFKYSLLQAVISFGVMRNLTSHPKEALAWLLESVNKNQLEAIRDGETYDYWKHGVTFRIMSEKDIGRNQWWKLLGPTTPALKFITKVNNSKHPIRDLTLGTAAFLGVAPFYKNLNLILYEVDKNR